MQLVYTLTIFKITDVPLNCTTTSQLSVRIGARMTMSRVYSRGGVLREWIVPNVMDGNKENFILLFIVRMLTLTRKKNLGVRKVQTNAKGWLGRLGRVRILKCFRKNWGLIFVQKLICSQLCRNS